MTAGIHAVLAAVAAFALAARADRAADASLLARMEPRTATARRVASFDAEELKGVFRERASQRAQEESFVLCGTAAVPTSEIDWDVCRDAEDVLHVTLYFLDYRKGPGAGNENSVEIGFSPYADCYTLLQAGVTGTNMWTNDFWPYKDGRANLAERFIRSCKVTFLTDDQGLRGVTERLVTFHVPVSAVAAPEAKGLVGFNLMRANLATKENAVWNATGGAAFSDASGFGYLRLDENAPEPTILAPERPLAGKPRIFIEYDWPDEMVNGPYSEAALRAELELLKRQNVSRLYWIDYPDFYAACKRPDIEARVARPDCPQMLKNSYATFKAMKGEDSTFVACRLAHELGLEFFVTVKPYDLFDDEFCKKTGDKYLVRTNPKWADPKGPKTVRALRLVKAGDGPLGFDPKAVRISTSADNRTYAAVTGWTVEERVEDLPNGFWTPAGKKQTDGTHKVRVLEFSGIPGACNYVAIEFPKGGWRFENVRHELFACDTDRGPVRGSLTTRRKGGVTCMDSVSSAPTDRPPVFEFEGSNAPVWGDETEFIDRTFGFGGGAKLGLALEERTTRSWMLEACFPEVRRYWMDFFVKRAVDMGADGVDVRAANHKDAPSWLSYSYAEPVLEAFRKRFGREPDGQSVSDLEQVRKIRGEGFTQFLREAGALLHQNGMKLEAHVEATMKAPPSVFGYQGIHFDWNTWISKKIVDGINLKYLGPFNRFVRSEIMPRARAARIPVHQIAAIGDPRSHWRTADESVSAMELCRLGGVEALNLYETLVYLRTYPTGENQIRGCALQVLKALKPLARRPAVPLAKTPLAVSFAKGGWNPEEWPVVRDARWSYVGAFDQRDDHVVNRCPDLPDAELFAKHSQDVYAARLYRTRFPWGKTFSATLSFDHRMAPGLLISDDLGTAADGLGELREQWEVIAYDEGLNVWHHFRRADGKPAYELAAACRGKLLPKTKYELKVKTRRSWGGVKEMEVTCGDCSLTFLAPGFPDAFYVGIMGCEGRNRFYDFKAE